MTDLLRELKDDCKMAPKTEGLIGAAIDYIEGIERERATLLAELKKREWVPVSERLPILGQACLVWFYEIRGESDRSDISVGHRTEDGWYVKTRHEHIVTHWVPLPEPPQQVKP